MTLLNQWRSIAYDANKTKYETDKFWNLFFETEKVFYNTLLNIQEHPILDTVENFANRFNVDIITMVGLLDGLNDSLKISNNMEKITENTIITLDYDAEKLYENAFVANAEHIYTLDVWNRILPNRNNKAKNQYIPKFQQPNTPKCPTCGSTNIEKISLTKKAFGGVMFGLFSKTARSQFKCEDCGYKW